LANIKVNLHFEKAQEKRTYNLTTLKDVSLKWLEESKTGYQEYLIN
tara:strand:- start:2043 stop:2180 length:138 start_codon:yes stop_codon:yes gene_type:complete